VANARSETERTFCFGYALRGIDGRPARIRKPRARGVSARLEVRRPHVPSSNRRRVGSVTLATIPAWWENMWTSVYDTNCGDRLERTSG
jgi:hypothetical protein